MIDLLHIVVSGEIMYFLTFIFCKLFINVYFLYFIFIYVQFMLYE